MAHSIGVSRETFARAERALHRSGLIERQTPQNGFRGRTSAKGTIAGISLAPMIGHLDRLIALRDEADTQLQEFRSLKLKISILRRKILALTTESEIRAIVLAQPTSSQIRTIELAEEIAAKLEDYLATAQSISAASQAPELTTACVKKDGCHIEPKKKLKLRERMPFRDVSNFTIEGDLQFYLESPTKDSKSHYSDITLFEAARNYFFDLGLHPYNWECASHALGPTRIIQIAINYSANPSNSISLFAALDNEVLSGINHDSAKNLVKRCPAKRMWGGSASE